MFGLFKKKAPQPVFNGNYSGLHTDMHSHLLPGIDDGAPDVDTSILLIKGMMELGYKKFITTPHIYPDLYPNTAATIQQAHAVLTQRLQQEQIDVEIKAAAEYFIDEQFPERIERKEPLLTLHQNWVLVEISFISPPADLNETIFKMVVAGYQPVLAHPERYSFYHHNKEVFHQFRDRGCMLQVNVLSLLGYYGKSVQETARMLVKEQLVDLVGTDLHHTRHLQAMRHPALMAETDALLQTGRLLNPTL
ncbi:MAG TPA: CpsB/CapC family capsule biosynthesis tyrosine phosphatase [Lacibacter sp.]|nr:CpsB/CapC family capsule biosynthesis tyrosine phosphatase [Lacibacter sp.]